MIENCESLSESWLAANKHWIIISHRTSWRAGLIEKCRIDQLIDS